MLLYFEQLLKLKWILLPIIVIIKFEHFDLYSYDVYNYTIDPSEVINCTQIIKIDDPWGQNVNWWIQFSN